MYCLNSEVLTFQLVHPFPDYSQLLPSVSVSAFVSDAHPNRCTEIADYSIESIYRNILSYISTHSGQLRELDKSTAPYAALICTSRAGGQSPQPSATCQNPPGSSGPEEVQISFNGLDTDGCAHDNSPLCRCFFVSSQ
ncbi:hypothetical protein Baya_12053 [Bagarius yarrelli]|uniref:Uncharacterized protein n=1 Tax=Bagarius yarrelli TaxID=175774 RepID=A0A556V2K9_BAGYA|nr:hypothetical protein Baya_12053 [Bagarius yarrelli]